MPPHEKENSPMKLRAWVLKPLPAIASATTAVLLLSASPTQAQVASPLQAGHYAPGVLNIRDMGNPPPGLFVSWYNWVPWTNTYIDRNGNELSSINLSELDPDLPDVDVDISGTAFAAVPALIWASPFTFLGGARYLAMVSPTFAVADYTILADPSGTGFDSTTTEVIEGSVSGLSDLYVVPVGLSWGSEFLDFTFMYGFYAPTGRYTTGAEDNIGLGFWTHQFQGFTYFYPLPEKATAIMGGLTYELNTKIDDVNVKPGNRLSLEWGISQYLSERFELGVQGAHNWQVSDDTGEDMIWDPTYRDRKSSIGFSMGFWPWKNRLYVSGKYAFDFGIRQRFKNNNLMLNFLFLTNALTGQ
jgi:hypothetical protein